MKGYLVIENFHPNLDPMSGHYCTFFFEKKNAEKKLGYYKRNQNVRIIEIDMLIEQPNYTEVKQ